MTRLYPTLVLALALTACGGTKAPAARPLSGPPAAASALQKPASSAEASGPVWSYSSAGKRDPFHSYLAEAESVAGAVSTRCSTPLGRFGVDQLKLVAVITGLDDPVAMVEAPNGIGYSVRRGACIGRNGGVISTVRSGEVVISEWTIRADGSRDKTQTVLRLPVPESLNIEE